MAGNMRKTISLMLAISMSAAVFGGCNIVTKPVADASSVPGTEISTTEASTTMNTEKTAEPSASESIILKTPDGKTVVDTTYVRTIDGVKPEMMYADYWIKEGHDQVLMTPEQIEEFNKNNKGVIKASDKTILPHPDDYEDTLDGKVLRSFLKDNEKAVPKDPSKYFLNGKPTTAEYWQELVALSNIDGVPETINVRYGFTTKRMTLRQFPTEDRVFDSKSDRYYDSILFSECMPYMPVVVLHESTDGNYLYAVFDSFAAWVRKDAIAFCKDKADWQARQKPGQRLVVTAREIRLGNDPYSSKTSNLVLPMGTRMELVPVSKAPQSISQRTTYGDYVVKVPTRGSDGNIKDEYVLIPVSDDVNVGFLPLTPANIVRQAMKLQGDRYGWGGDLQANDCTGITREIYRCFGVLLTRTGQTNSKGVSKTDMRRMSDKKKLEVIEKLTPGSLISMPGHMMIYLGTVNGKPYVISACGSFVDPAPGSTEARHPNSVIICSLYVRTRSLKTWLAISTTALTITPAADK